ncbi:hypothetical protein JG687_00011430, partial [Phytophthora cactorum]
CSAVLPCGRGITLAIFATVAQGWFHGCQPCGCFLCPHITSSPSRNAVGHGDIIPLQPSTTKMQSRQNDVTTERHRASMLARLRHGYTTVIQHLRRQLDLMLHAKAAKVMKTVFCDNWDPVSGLQRPGARYVLCFDGGPRGNPGPGGSGAVVVCVGQDMAEIRICWVGSMLYAARTTLNNVAE